MLETPKSLRHRLWLLATVLAMLIGLAAAWSWTPMREWLDIDRIVSMLQTLGQAFGPVAAVAAFAAASTIAVPLTFLTLVTILAFGPAGVIYTLIGASFGAAASYGLGRILGREVVQRMAGERVNALSRRLAARGIVAVIAVRMVPIAPYAIINMVAGASHIRLRDFLLGNVLGMTPGAVIMMLFVDQIIAAMKQPGGGNLIIPIVMLLLIVLGTGVLRRWLRKSADR